MNPHLDEASKMLRMAQRDLKALEVLLSDADVHFSSNC
jgi:hypothetical protein